MAFKVLVVDDSSFFRRRVREILDQDPNITTIGDARNGKDAIAQVKELDPDVVTMDVEMPVMDGITAVRQIMAAHPVPILMFSSLTHEGAQATLDALDAGALDFLPKKFEEIALDKKEALESLRFRVKALARKKGSVIRATQGVSGVTAKPAAKPTMFFRSSGVSAPEEPKLQSGKLSRGSGKNYRCLAIGSSTGGPIALQTILTQLPANFPVPILLVQHMPGTFTAAFADRLDQLCKIRVKHAEEGDTLNAGTAYLAPGGKQLKVKGTSQHATLSILDDPGTDLTYKPSVDFAFDTVASVYAGNCLGLILTGMGADGKQGCAKLKRSGSTIWAQDEKSSVVYGMPQAVTVAGIAEANYALGDIAENILKEFNLT